MFHFFFISLFLDPNIMKKSGRIQIVAELAREYGFKDVGGKLKCFPSLLPVVDVCWGFSFFCSRRSEADSYIKGG